MSLAFVWGIHRGRVNSPHQWPETRKMFSFDDVIMGDTNHLDLFHTGTEEYTCINRLQRVDLQYLLTPKHRETHGCVVSTVATDALVLKHQAISIHNADWTFIVLDQFYIEILHLWCTTLENKITFWKKIYPVV